MLINFGVCVCSLFLQLIAAEYLAFLPLEITE